MGESVTCTVDLECTMHIPNSLCRNFCWF